MHDKPGDIISEKYRLIESVGGGAMGKVFKAEHMLMHKTVAIKILNQGMNENVEMIERFRREASSAANIDHVNVCSVMDFAVTDEGEFYLVMEYLEGRTLHKKIREEGGISPKEAVFILKQLLSALQCAHDHGIVHRDVKPENVVLISKEGTDNFVKLLDFGIAHQEETSSIQGDEEGTGFKTKAGFIYGTPEYISPEQANGGEIDNRTDLYACGIILYEMLTGAVPFESDSLVQILHWQVFKEVPHLENGSVECAEAFDKIIQKLLAKRPQDRYSSALEVIDALDAIELSEPASGNAAANSHKTSAPQFNGSLKPVAMELKSFKAGKMISSTYQRMPKKWRRIAWAGFGVFLILCFVAGVVAKPLKKVSEIQPYLYSEKDSILNDSTLGKDPNLGKAVDAFYQKDYQTCYENVAAVDGRYAKHPNYLRFRMQAAMMYAKTAGKTADISDLTKGIVSDFLALSEMVPDAARNGAVAEAIGFAFTDSKKVSSSAAVAEFVKADSRHAVSALAWAVLYLPYDQNEKRKSSTLAALDALSTEDLPEWQKMALDAWRLGKEKCRDRNEKLRKALTSGASNEALYYGILVPLNEQSGRNCKDLFKTTDCNQCMRSWIKAGYKEWSELEAEGRLESATLSFLEETK